MCPCLDERQIISGHCIKYFFSNSSYIPRDGRNLMSILPSDPKKRSELLLLVIILLVLALLLFVGYNPPRQFGYTSSNDYVHDYSDNHEDSGWNFPESGDDSASDDSGSSYGDFYGSSDDGESGYGDFYGSDSDSDSSYGDFFDSGSDSGVDDWDSGDWDSGDSGWDGGDDSW